jgi:uncharacterized protein YciI
MKTFAFFYLMDSFQAEEIKKTVDEHIQYWDNLKLEGYQGGAFADYSGGLILFQAENEDQAKAIVHDDPFVDHFILTKKWVKEWQPE